MRRKIMYVLAAFGSRTQVLEFIEQLRSRGIAARAVNTPSDAHIGCGISAEFPYEFTGFARSVVQRYGLDSLKGFYLYERRGGRTVVRRI